MSTDRCPQHPTASGESQYGGLWCWGADRACKWAVKEFVNEHEDGELEKVTKYRLPSGGKWMSPEDYALAVAGGAADAPAKTPMVTPPDDGDAFEGMEVDAPTAPQPARAPREAQDGAPSDRDTIIAREVALKAAVEALCTYPGDETAQEVWKRQVLALAGLFTDWVLR